MSTEEDVVVALVPKTPLGQLGYGDDIFATIDRIFSGQKAHNPHSAFILHRFLGSDRDFCEIAKELQKDVVDPQMVMEIWRAAVPRGRPPRLKYTGPRKGKAAEGLVERIMRVWGYNREQADEAVDLITTAGKLEDACAEFGVEVKEEK